MLQPSLQGLFHFEVTYILYDFQRKGLRLKLGGVNLFLWEPLLDPLKTVPPPFFPFPQEEDMSVHFFWSKILSVLPTAGIFRVWKSAWCVVGPQ